MKRKIITLLTIICMLCTMGVPVFGAENQDAGKLSNPRTAADGSVTWDCVNFGHYPQTRVKETDAVYQTLKNESNWNENNEVEVAGTKYCRAQQKDDDGNVVSGSPWEYYRYDPIKWRVLSINGDEALLLADKSLDSKRYNETDTSVTWETSTIRSWLNGYGSGFNQDEKDYTRDNFISKAFSSAEQGAIQEKIIQNPDNPEFGTAGGNPTTDSVFFLSIDEATKPAYGFPYDYSEASKTRRALNTEYTKAQGAYTNTSTEYADNGYWWLRSPGDHSGFAAIVYCYGDVYYDGAIIYVGRYAVRPALFLNLKSNLWSYAGTVPGEQNSNAEQQGTNSHSSTPAAKTQKPKAVTLKKVSSPKKKQLKLTWKKDAKATGYQAVVATDKKFKKNKKAATIKKNKTVTKTFKKLKSKKTYFAKVRAYKKVGKKNLYGAYSKVKKAKVK